MEHLARALAVAGGDERRVEIEEAALVEEGVDGHGHVVAQTHDRSEGVGAQTQVSNLAQELHAVPLLLQRIGVGVGLAIHHYLPGLHLDGLTAALALHQTALDADAGACGDAFQLLLKRGRVGHNLYVVYNRAVVDGEESHILVAALGAHPTFDTNRGAKQSTHILFQKIFDFVTFHLFSDILCAVIFTLDSK